MASYVGYETKEIKCLAKSKINVSLDLDNSLELYYVGFPSYSYHEDGEPYEYIPTPEELAEQKQINSTRISNHKKFYARKFKEAQAERKRKRKERRANRNK